MSHYDKKSNGWASVETSIDDPAVGLAPSERDLDTIDAMANVQPFLTASSRLCLARRKLTTVARDLNALDRISRTYGTYTETVRENVESESIRQLRFIVNAQS